MSWTKDSFKDFQNTSSVANRTSFGGGFQVPKTHESYLASSKETAGFNDSQIKNLLNNPYSDPHQNQLLSSIDQEIARLRGTSQHLTDVNTI